MPRRTNEKFYTVEEIASRLNESTKSVRRKLKAGKIPYYKFSRSVRIGDADFDEYVGRCRVEKNA